MISFKRPYGEKCRGCKGGGYQLIRPALKLLVCPLCDGFGVAGAIVQARWKRK